MQKTDLLKNSDSKLKHLWNPKKDPLEDILFQNIDEPNNTESELYQNLFDNFDFDFDDFFFNFGL